MSYRVREYHRCPDCGKKGVTLRFNRGGDAWQCRYCDWAFFHTSNDRIDVTERARFAKVNPARFADYTCERCAMYRGHPRHDATECIEPDICTCDHQPDPEETR